MQAKIAAISEVVSLLVKGIKEGQDIDLNDVKKQASLRLGSDKSLDVPNRLHLY